MIQCIEAPEGMKTRRLIWDAFFVERIYWSLSKEVLRNYILGFFSSNLQKKLDNISML